MVGPAVATPTAASQLAGKACVVGHFHNHDPVIGQPVAAAGEEQHRIELVLENARENDDVHAPWMELAEAIDAGGMDAAAAMPTEPGIRQGCQFVGNLNADGFEAAGDIWRKLGDQPVKQSSVGAANIDQADPLGSTSAGDAPDHAHEFVSLEPPLAKHLQGVAGCIDKRLLSSSPRRLLSVRQFPGKLIHEPFLGRGIGQVDKARLEALPRLPRRRGYLEPTGRPRLIEERTMPRELLERCHGDAPTECRACEGRPRYERGSAGSPLASETGF